MVLQIYLRNTHDFGLNRVFLTIQSEIGVITNNRMWQKKKKKKNALKVSQVWLAQLHKPHYSY